VGNFLRHSVVLADLEYWICKEYLWAFFMRHPVGLFWLSDIILVLLISQWFILVTIWLLYL